MDQLRVERVVRPYLPLPYRRLQLRICSPLAGIANGSPLSTTFGPNSCGKHKSVDQPKKQKKKKTTETQQTHRKLVYAFFSLTMATRQRTREHSDVGSMRRLGAFTAFFWPSKWLWPKPKTKKKNKRSKRKCRSGTRAHDRIDDLAKRLRKVSVKIECCRLMTFRILVGYLNITLEC